MNQPTIKHLSSGYLHIRWSRQCWAQIPAGWSGPIPDEYIFAAEWNREKVNQWWKER